MADSENKPDGYVYCSGIDPCQDERAALEQQCGVGNYYIDEDTCEGDCKCNDNDNDGICNACDLDANDPEITNVAWIWMKEYEPDGSLCNLSFVYKKSDCNNISSSVFYETSPGSCSEASVAQAQIPCISYKVNDNCTEDNCDVCDIEEDWLTDLVDSATINLNPNTPEPDTDEKTDECRRKCFPRAFMYVPGSDTCICVNDSDQTDNDENPSEGTDQPTDDPETPETGSPNEQPGDGAGDNELLDSIDENTRATTQNTKAIAEEQARTNQLLDWIGQNSQTTTDNTAKIENSIDGVGGKLDGLGQDVRGLGNKITGVGDDIEGVGEQLGEDINQMETTLGEKLDTMTGELTGTNEPTQELPNNIPPAYSVGEHSWGERTNQFLTDMSGTGLFAVPTDFLDAAPGGGSPELVIDGGETYGVHSLSFADYSTGLIAIRAAIQLAFMWLAIRIVTLKR
ncbi:hypothetical protein [Desulfofustis glycolicus]|nr:hypothetical protein [Desulfofustis glycolicus]MCB2216111.1 hypothetical protein [Desulfobulbaceae bacterium]